MAGLTTRMAMSGNTVTVDLADSDGQPVTVLEARERVAKHLCKPLAFVRFLDPGTSTVLQDGDAPITEEAIVVVGVDPAIEQAAEDAVVSAARVSDMAQLEDAERLNLSSKDLVTLPESLCYLDSLRQLNLMHNQLTALPQSLCRLTALQELDLRHNQFTTLPEIVGHLSALERLYLGGNKLTTLPESIGLLTGLKQLDLTNNRITTTALPESLGLLTSLEYIGLFGNRLASRPERLVHLSAYILI